MTPVPAPEPFPRMVKGRTRAHLIYHYPGELGSLNDRMSTVKANALLYAEPNSLRGLQKRTHLGINSCDNDIIVSKGPSRFKGARPTVWVSHWDEARESWVGFHPDSDPKGHPRWSSTNISQMYDEDIARLINVVEGYRMWTLFDYIEQAIHLGSGASFEQKFHPFLRSGTCWPPVMAHILRLGGAPDQFMVHTLPSPSAAPKALLMAGQAGFLTGFLSGHGTSGTTLRALMKLSRASWAKGSAAAVDRYLPTGAQRIGGSPASATCFGCSVSYNTVSSGTQAVRRHGGNPTLWPRP